MNNWFSGVKPFDWLMLVIEALVLLIIAAEAIISLVSWGHKSSATKKIMVFLSDGEKLRDAAPKQNDVSSDVVAWNKKVITWTGNVQRFLNAQKSKQAIVVFNQRPFGPPYFIIGLHPSVNEAICDLDTRLKCLHSIMERADVYF